MSRTSSLSVRHRAAQQHLLRDDVMRLGGRLDRADRDHDALDRVGCCGWPRSQRKTHVCRRQETDRMHIMRTAGLGRPLPTMRPRTRRRAASHDRPRLAKRRSGRKLPHGQDPGSLCIAIDLRRCRSAPFMPSLTMGPRRRRRPLRRAGKISTAVPSKFRVSEKVLRRPQQHRRMPVSWTQPCIPAPGICGGHAAGPSHLRSSAKRPLSRASPTA